MSQAETLLSTLSTTTVEHKHSVPDSDTYFLVNPYTREIENTTYNKTVLMRGDHNSERFTFEIPRYVDGHDMSLCNRVIVHFDNVGESVYDSYSDIAYMTDLRINPDNPETVISSWLIRREATQIVGILSFSLQYQCVEDEEITYEWNTDSYDDIEIRKSKNNGEAAVIEFTNVLEQWRAQLFDAGDSIMANITSEGETQVAAVQNESAVQQAAIELKGSETLATIPDDYTDVYNMAEEALRTKGDGIVCEVTDTTIAVSDSSDDYIRGLSVYGKSTQVTTNGYQLFDADSLPSNTLLEATVTNNGDGSFTVSGSGTFTGTYSGHVYDYSHEDTIRLLRAGTYTLSCGAVTYPYVYMQLRNSSSNLLNITGSTNAISSNTVTQEMLDDAGVYMRIGFYGLEGSSIVTGTVKPMLYIDGDGTWEPYSAGYASPSPYYPQEIVSVETARVDVYGKNLINVTTGGVATGVTETVHDGLVDFSGTATGNGGRVLWKRSDELTLYPGTYTMRLTYSSGTAPTACLSKTGTHALVINGNDTTFTVDETTTVFLGFNYIADRTYDAVNVGVQLEVGDTATEYVPYVAPQVLTTQHTLPGIPVTSGGNYTDSDGQQWICDEVDLEQGVYVQRTETVTLDGSKTYFQNAYRLREGLYVYGVYIDNSSHVEKPVLCDKLRNQEWGNLTAGYGDKIYDISGALYIFLDDQTIDTVEAFTEYMANNSMTAVRILKTPIKRPLTDDEIETFKTMKSNYPNTTVFNDANAMMKLKYNADTKLYIDNASIDGAASVVEEILYETY